MLGVSGADFAGMERNFVRIRLPKMEDFPILLEAVQRHIGGSGRVAGVQESHVGSGKGYVAVRPMAKTNLDGYAAGYITNALENGHAVRPASGKAKKKRQSRAKANRVQGKYMYRNTGQQEAKRAAEEGARIIEAKILAHMEGRSV